MRGGGSGMRSAVRFIVRQSGWLVFFLFLFALANAAYVCEGLGQGVGLYGYVIQHSAKGGPPRIVSVWAAFVQMLVFTGLAGVLLIICWFNARHGLNPVAEKGPASRGRKTKTRGR